MNVNQVNLYELQESFEKVMQKIMEQLDVDEGVMADLCLSYVRNMVVQHVGTNTKTR